MATATSTMTPEQFSRLGPRRQARKLAEQQRLKIFADRVALARGARKLREIADAGRGPALAKLKEILARKAKVESDLRDLCKQEADARNVYDRLVEPDGWNVNQIMNLGADPILARAIHHLTRHWDGRRNSPPSGDVSNHDLDEWRAECSHIKSGIEKLRALQFDPDIETIEQLDALCEEILVDCGARR